MNYFYAKKKALVSKSLGYILMLICFITLTISILNALYFHFDNSPLLEGIAKLVKSFVNLIYQNTQFLKIFWDNTPIPNLMNPFDKSNLGFIAIYVVLFVGASMVRYGNRLLKRLRKIDEQIQDELMKNQLKGIVRHESELREVISIPSNSFHSLYLAPIIVGLLIPFIMFFIKKAFGL